MTSASTLELIEGLRTRPYARHGAWTFDYEYPGFFVYRHDLGKKVYFTPDWNDPGMVDIQIVQAGYDEPSVFTAVPYREPLTPDQLFRLVRPYLRIGSNFPSRKDWDPRMGAPADPEAVRDRQRLYEVLARLTYELLPYKLPRKAWDPRWKPVGGAGRQRNFRRDIEKFWDQYELEDIEGSVYEHPPMWQRWWEGDAQERQRVIELFDAWLSDPRGHRGYFKPGTLLEALAREGAA